MPFLAVAGGEIYYETDGAGPAVVFAHGLGGNHLSWWQQVPALRDRYLCVTFAHRGFAPSRESPGGPGPAAFSDDLAALVVHLALADVRLVAQSMGGRTCLRYALRAPERVKALVLGGTSASLEHPDLDRMRPQGDVAADLFARGIHPAAGERMAREQPALHFLYRQISALAAVGGLDRDALLAKFGPLPTTRPEEVAALKFPVLCLVGEEDVFMGEAGALVASLFPRGRYVRVPRAGHSVYFERADIFNRIVGEFLDEG